MNNNKYKYVFLDTETTGMSRNDRVIQLSFITYINGETVAYDTYGSTDNGAKIRKSAQDIHGITEEDIAFLPPMSLTKEYEYLQELALRNDVIIFAHNANFDIRMLSYSGFRVRCKVIDTLKVARDLFNFNSNKLEDIVKNTEINNNVKSVIKDIFIDENHKLKAHNSLSDVIMLKGFVDYFTKRINIESIIDLSIMSTYNE